MGYNVTRSAQFFDKEVLKYPQWALPVKSVVLDGNAFPPPADSNTRNVVPAGTVLKFSATYTKRYVKYNGSGTVEGILARSIDIMAQSTAGSAPAPMFYFDAIFATTQLVDFTLYASALVSSLTHCKFE